MPERPPEIEDAAGLPPQDAASAMQRHGVPLRQTAGRVPERDSDSVSRQMSASGTIVFRFLGVFAVSFLALEGLEHLLHEWFEWDLKHRLSFGGVGVVIIYGLKFHVFCCVVPALLSALACIRKRGRHCSHLAAHQARHEAGSASECAQCHPEQVVTDPKQGKNTLH
jgi:hypothetical protein